MRYAIFSDLHDNFAAYRQVVKDAEQLQADSLICLGDIGRSPGLLAEVRNRVPVCTFGNWEVSSLPSVPPPLHDWLAQLPATARSDRLSTHNSPTTQPAILPNGDIGAGALFCHATPDMPSAAATTATAAAYMKTGVRWLELFPLLNRNDAARWQALAELEASNRRVAFHGHTHLQLVWGWEQNGCDPANRRLRSFTQPAEFVLQPGSSAAPNRYLVGVGSAGAAEEGPFVCYALYDTVNDSVHLRRLPTRA